MSNPVIAMVGVGVVGKATAEAFHSKGIRCIQIDPAVHPKSKIENALAADIAMICVPTPMMPTSGRQDTSIVAEVIRNLSAIDYKGLICIKSTVLPSFVVDICLDYAHLNICTNPEFLTERTAEDNAADPTFLIIGGSHADAEYLDSLYRIVHPELASDWMSAPGAMMFKYLYNTLGAATVSIVNEFYQMHKRLKLDDWGRIQSVLTIPNMLDERTQVPGPDGKLGFGGKCFPKDCNAIINMARDLGTPAETLEGAIATNHVVRKGE